MMIDMASGKRVDKSKDGKPTQVPVDGPVADLLRALCKKYKRDQKEVVEASVRWLTALGREVAGPMLNYMPDDAVADFAKLILMRMAAGASPQQIQSDQSTEPASTGATDPVVFPPGSLGGHGEKGQCELHHPKTRRVVKGGQ